MSDILALHADEMRELHSTVTVMEAASAAAQYAQRCPISTVLWLAEHSGAIVGFARGEIHENLPFVRLKATPRAGYIDEVYVIPSYRKRGVALQLLRIVSKALFEAGAVSIWGKPSCKPLRQLYEQLGASDMGAMIVTREAFKGAGV